MSEPPCVYRDLSDEAYSLDAVTGSQRRIEVWLCTWPTTLKALPPRIAKMIGGGISIMPEQDCTNCPARCDSLPTPSGEG